MKKALSILLAALLFMLSCNWTEVIAADRSVSGKCGDHLTWTYDYENETLTIDGNGAMWNYDANSSLAKNFTSSASNVKKVVFHEGITSIGNYAFAVGKSTDGERHYRGTIKEISIPGTVSSIGDSAFEGYTSQELNLIIPGSVKTIGNHAFSASKSVTISDGVEEIGDYAFSGCLQSGKLILPESIKSIGSSAFSGWYNITSVELPKNLTKISSGMFMNCSSLEKVKIPDSVTCIEDSAFRRCKKLKEVILPNKLISIGPRAFAGDTALEIIDFPETLTSIGSNAFGDSSEPSGLKKVTVPKNITYIGKEAFNSCHDLTAINVDKNNKTYTSYDGCLYEVHNPAKHINKWGDKLQYGGDFDVDYTLYGVPGGKTSVNFLTGTNQTDIDKYAFWDCNKITSLVIPAKVKIDSDTDTLEYVFYYITNLKDVYFDEYTKEDIARFMASSNVATKNLIRFPEGTTLHFKGDIYHTRTDTTKEFTEDMLFKKEYAHYLLNESTSNTVLSLTNDMVSLFAQKDIGRDMLGAVKSALKDPDKTLSFMLAYTLKNTTGVDVNYSMNDWSREMALELVREMLYGGMDGDVETNADAVNDIIEDVNKKTKIPKKVYDIYKNGIHSESDLRAVAEVMQQFGLDEKEAYKFIKGSYEDPDIIQGLDVLSGLVGYTVSAAEVTVEVAKANEVADQVYVRLMASIPEDSYLYAGLQELRSETKRNLTDTMLLKIAKSSIEKAIADGGKKLIGAGSISGVVYGLAGIASELIPESTIEDQFKTCIAMDNQVVLYQAIQKRIYYFMENDPDGDEGIKNRKEGLKLLFNTYLASVRKAHEYLMNYTKYLESSKSDTGLSELRKRVQQEFNGDNSTFAKLSYRSYLNACLQEARLDLAYTTPDGKAYIQSREKGDGTAAEFVSIPQEINGVSVVGISDNAMKDNADITVLTVPDTVETIGKNAFSGCSNLSRIFMGNSVKTIDSKAFENCTSLKEISIPSSTNRIADDAFDGVIGLTIYGDKGSSAEKYAEDHGYRFIANPRSVKSLSIKTYPKKTSFSLHEALNFTGMVLMVEYTDGSSEEVSDGYTVAMEKKRELGENTIDIFYQDTLCQMKINFIADTCDYTIHYVDENGALISSDQTGKETAGKTISIPIKQIEGYTPVSNEMTETIGEFNEFNVVYKKNPVSADKIELNKKSLTLRKGSTESLYVNFTPEDTTNTEIIWSSDNEKAVSVDDDGKVTAVGAGEAVITAKLKDGTLSDTCRVTVKTDEDNAFKDVTKDQYYYEAVQWGTGHAVVSGYSEKDGTKTFRADDTCTRAQFVTFLWRTFGSQKPKSTKNPFVDIPNIREVYYCDAVLWAYENGYVSGYSDPKGVRFGADDEVTRGQVVTFLWRAAGSPKPTSAKSPFVDVKNPSDHFYGTAMLWASENGIVSGYSDPKGAKFAPDDSCTRGQVVTFLWRYAQKFPQ